jgi:hypothetical protein
MRAYIIVIVSLINYFTAYSQEPQDRNMLREGTTWEYTVYNGRGKAKQKATVKVTSVDSTESQIQYKMLYRKEKLRKILGNKLIVETDDYIMQTRDTFQISLSSFLQYKYRDNIAPDWSESDDLKDPGLKFPVDIEVKDELEDSKPIEIPYSYISSHDDNFRTAIWRRQVKQREVESTETLQTAAGDFKTYAISQRTFYYKPYYQDYESRIDKIWFLPGFGIIRAEFYDGLKFDGVTDNLILYYELTSYKY